MNHRKTDYKKWQSQVRRQSAEIYRKGVNREHFASAVQSHDPAKNETPVFERLESCGVGLPA